MVKKFQQLPMIAKVLLLLIPVVNWVTEIVVRVSAFIEKRDTHNLIGLILAFIGNVILGWVDLVWVILFGHLVFSKV